MRGERGTKRSARTLHMREVSGYFPGSMQLVLRNASVRFGAGHLTPGDIDAASTSSRAGRKSALMRFGEAGMSLGLRTLVPQFPEGRELPHLAASSQKVFFPGHIAARPLLLAPVQSQNLP